MFELDKEAFGRFLAEQRKAKGYTQKQLAEQLFVSDKAVSKWERALSMPDISLLIPLAEILEVSVTELLEGRRLEHTEELDPEYVECLVKKALSFSEETPERKKEQQKKRAALFGGYSLLGIVEILVFWALGYFVKKESGFSWGTHFFVMEGLSFIFGIHFWIFMKERLPAYYDENNIELYSDGFFRLHVPGLSLNNKNWLHIVKMLRLWSVLTMLILPLLFFILDFLVSNSVLLLGIQTVLLVLYLISLFVPIYGIGIKYGSSASYKNCKKDKKT